MQARLATSECNAAICGDKIQFINPNFIIERLRRILYESVSVAQRLRIQAISTTERTAMKGNKRSDSIAIGRKAMPCDAYYLSPLLFHVSIVCN